MHFNLCVWVYHASRMMKKLKTGIWLSAYICRFCKSLEAPTVVKFRNYIWTYMCLKNYWFPRCNSANGVFIIAFRFHSIIYIYTYFKSNVIFVTPCKRQCQCLEELKRKHKKMFINFKKIQRKSYFAQNGTTIKLVGS